MKYALLFLVLLCAGLTVLWRSGDSRIDPAEKDFARSAEVGPEATQANETRGDELTDLPAASRPPRGALDTTSPPGDSRRLHGQVVAPDGQGLPGAVVALLLQQGEDPEQAIVLDRTASGTEGRFTIGLPAGFGPLILMSEAPGFREALVPVGERDDVRLVLEPLQHSVIVVGRVVDAGRVLPEFLVRDSVLIPSEKDLRVEEVWTPVHQEGQGFSIALATLGARETQLAIRARGYLDETRKLVTNGDARIDVGVIELRRSMAHRGFVADLAGAPIGNATVTALLALGDRGPSTRSDPSDGSFELLTKEGQEPVALLASAKGYAPQLVTREEAGGFWDGVVIHLDVGSKIDGLVMLADGRPAESVPVRAWLAEATGSELPGGAMGSAAWLRTTKTDDRGNYSFGNVPRGSVAVGVDSGQSGDNVSLRRTRTLQVTDDGIYACDFTLGDGRTLRGALEFPIPMSHKSVCLELQVEREGKRVSLASLQAPPSQPFVFEDVTLDPPDRPMFLRISLAPGFHVDRQVVARGPEGDLGTIRFESVRALMEFNRGERRIFGVRPER